MSLATILKSVNDRPGARENSHTNPLSACPHDPSLAHSALENCEEIATTVERYVHLIQRQQSWSATLGAEVTQRPGSDND